MHRGRDIMRRSKGNPLITLDDMPFRCADICTAGAIKWNGEYVLLMSIQSLEGISMICLAPVALPRTLRTRSCVLSPSRKPCRI